MKKTLIALAVAASAAVSGSAMAWTANGIGSSVELGGTLTPVDVVTPWEVKTGDAVTGLDAQIKEGQKTVDIAVNKAIPVLGIRTIQSTAFSGQAGISPQINYGAAVDVDGFAANETTLNLEVKDSTGNNKIGTLSAPLYAVAEQSIKGPDVNYRAGVIAGYEGALFFGGLSKSEAGYSPVFDADAVVPDVTAHYDPQGQEWINNAGWSSVSDPQYTYSAYYASGIKQGKTIKITLDNSAGADEIVWKASLPVTVSYQ
ncbi:hypothetical protein [Escherichia coli]|uniref:F4 family fimbrial subunit n=1 Tax=Escherichia coli TaxID=562 RepID=UPI00191A9E64|nr:hypothetical protein [Escherichia coli]CAD6120238.1 Fimbrial major/minor subunit [Escherichia coli]CAD6181850.1 Fimbrial major/minor subunit [Escherichia coli]